MLVFVVSLVLGCRPYSWAYIPIAFVVMILMALALTSFGAGLASMVQDFQGFQGINNFLVFPLFFLSSALYPLNNVPDALRIAATLNPVSYMVDFLRYMLINQTHFGVWKDLTVVFVVLVLCVAFAVNRFNRIEA